MDNSNTQRQERRGSNVDEEVQKLLRRSDKVSANDFQMLRSKLGDAELVNKIERVYFEKFSEVNKRAKKFAKLIREKYADSKYPYHVLLEKALKYKQKYNLSEAEFTEFQRRFESELAGLNSPDIYQPQTNIMNLLGNVNVNLQGFTGKLNEYDFKTLQEILKLHATSKPLHAQVVLQSMQYVDCSIEAVTGKYNRDSHNVSNHVHPVIAALFLPKIQILDNHFLLSNVSNIVRTRYQNEQFSSVADMELYYALSRDPNDIVCDSRSTVTDLHHRAQLQNQLWNSVLALRNGQYYNNSFSEFIRAIDMCKLNKYDNPDLIYGRSDAIVLKRLVSAFSFRPTIVTTVPAYGIFSTNPYQQNITPVVTYVHMVNLKLPSGINDSSPINLRDALEQNQLFIENNNLVPKHTSLIYSRGILIFYVDRRANVIKLDQTMNPFSMTKLPLAVAGFDRLNDREVNFDNVIKIGEDQYKLRSVVLSEINNTPGVERNLVVGSSTIIMNHPKPSEGTYDTECLMYDPYSVVHKKIEDGKVLSNNPITYIPLGPSLSDDGCTFIEMARTRGIIFVYQLVESRKEIVIAP
jgi:hypothetical protein